MQCQVGVLFDKENWNIETSYLITISIILLLYVPTLILWLLYKEKMPIKQRSAYISFLCLLFLFVRTLEIPFLDLLQVRETSNNDYLNSQTIQTVISVLDYFTWSGLFTSYMFKFLRILYVFNNPLQDQQCEQTFNQFFQNEQFLLISIIVITIMYTVACYFLLDGVLFSWVTDPYCHVINHASKFTDFVFWIIDTLFKVVMLVLIFYIGVSSKVPSTYLLRLEIGCVIFFYYFFINEQYAALYFFSGYNPDDELTEGFIWMNFVSPQILLLFSGIIPLVKAIRRSNLRLPMVEKNVLNFLHTFMLDEVCVEVFSKYVNKMAVKYREQQNLPIYLNFMLDYTRQEDPGTLKEEYFDQCQLKLFGQGIRKNIEHTFREQQVIEFEDFKDAYQYAFRIIESQFINHYSKTYSYTFLKKQFIQNQRVYQRLIKFKMTTPEISLLANQSFESINNL